MQRYNQRMIEIVKSRQQQERSRLPKVQRSEAKTRLAIFKKSIRINSSVSSSEERERIKQVRCASPSSFSFSCLFFSRLIFFPPSVFIAGGEAAEDGAAASATETREPDERADRPVWRQHQGAAAAPGELPLISSHPPWRCCVCIFAGWVVTCSCVLCSRMKSAICWWRTRLRSWRCWMKVTTRWWKTGGIT